MMHRLSDIVTTYIRL